VGPGRRLIGLVRPAAVAPPDLDGHLVPRLVAVALARAPRARLGGGRHRRSLARRGPLTRRLGPSTCTWLPVPWAGTSSESAVVWVIDVNTAGKFNCR
jgi:hypothetical protein